MSIPSSSKLNQILESTRLRVAASKAGSSISALEKMAREHTPRGFRHALAHRAYSAPAIIAELKKASPSKGLLRADLPVAALAREFEAAGATCLSVLTEPEFFLGGLGNLELASSAAHLPCLRKDFIVDEFQLLESRAHSADAVLLIAAALTTLELKQLNAAARAMDLDVLCEVHQAEELERALEAGCMEMIGVNNRNLHDFSVTLDTALELASRIPEGTVRVAESGIASGEDIAKLRAAGFHGFLIGENLMRAQRPGDALREMIEAAQAVRA
ncbi:MAG: indole-3-glycerol phosphate synthase TrpC [Acidobacteriaceae bacterium]